MPIWSIRVSARCRWRSRWALPRIEQVYVAALEIVRVARGDGEAVNAGGGRNQAVHRAALGTRVQPPPFVRHLDVDPQNTIAEALAQFVKPLGEHLSLLWIAAAQALDPLANLADAQDAQIEILVLPSLRPRGDVRVTAPPDLGDHIGVQEDAHKSTSRPASDARARSRRSKLGARRMNSSRLGRPRSRWYSSTETTTTAGLPCLVTTCGPSPRARSTSSLRCCFAACSCQAITPSAIVDRLDRV